MFRKLTYGSVFSAVEFASNNSFNLLSLKKKKNELEILQKEHFDDFTSLIFALKGKKHLFLILNNEQVLTKEVHVTHIAKESVVKTAFPNISLNDFHFEVFDNGFSSIVAICRKEAVEEAVRDLQEKGVSVVQISLGSTSFQRLLPFLNDHKFHTSRGVFEVKDHKVVEWKKGEEVAKAYEVNGLTVDSNQLLTLGGVISYCNGVDKSIDEDYQQALFKEYQQKRTFQLGIRFGLGSLLLILLINFFVFSSYRGQVSRLTTELSMNEVYRKQLLSLDNLVIKKKRLVESMSAVSNSKVMWYFEEVAKSVPNTISLDNLEYQPVNRSIKKDKAIILRTNEMNVKGIAKNDSDFTNWVNQLERRDWIQKVSIIDIGGENSRYTAFEFVIYFNPDIK